MQKRQNPELFRLSYAYLEDQASPEEASRLDDLLRADPAARVEFVELMEMVASFVWQRSAFHLEREAADAEIAVQPAPRAIARPIRKPHWTQTIFSPRNLAVAACVLLMCYFAGLAGTLIWDQYQLARLPAEQRTTDARQEQPDSHSAPRAVLTAVKATGVKTRTGKANSGDPISNGPVTVDGGVVEIRFKSGAQVSVEGPARFEAKGDNLLRVDLGQLTAVVPPKAIGFTVETPSLRVVDLGTEFGVDVRASGQSEVQVYRGSVEAHSVAAQVHSKSTPRLTAGQAARATRAAAPIVAIAASETALSQTAAARRVRNEDAPRVIATRSNPVPAGAIQIDGKFDDWQSIEMFPEESGRESTVSAKSIDIVRTGVAHDEERIYVFFEQGNPAPLDHGHWWVLDTDQNENTGLRGQEQSDTYYSSVGGEYTATAHHNVTRWAADSSSYENGKAVDQWLFPDLGGKLAVSSDGLRLEYSYPRTIFGNPKEFNCIWVGANRWEAIDGDRGLTESYPNGAGEKRRPHCFKYILIPESK